LEIRDFVVETVALCQNKTPYDDDRLLTAATKLAAWARTVAGLPLQVDILFRREIIGNFVATGTKDLRPATRGNLRAQLFRMSEVLVLQHRSRSLTPFAPSDPSRPYTSQEVAILRVWANTESTAERSANANVLLSLGLGAGLSAAEIGNTRAADIRLDGDGVTVHVTGERARDVPILPIFEPALRDRVATLQPDRFVFRPDHIAYYPNLLSNFVARSHITGPVPQAKRMRTTWIVHHLDRGTPVQALMRASGIESLTAFSRYASFLAEVEDAAYLALLRGVCPG